MSNCSVLWCKNATTDRNKETDADSEVIYHLFPKSPTLKQIWTMATGQNTDWIPDNFSSICSVHFEKSCFAQSVTGSNGSLNKSAIPTLNLTESCVNKSGRKGKQKDDTPEESNSNESLWFMQSIDGSCALLSKSDDREQPFYLTMNENFATKGDVAEDDFRLKSDSNGSDWLWQNTNGSRILLDSSDEPLVNLLSRVEKEDKSIEPDAEKDEERKKEKATPIQPFCVNETLQNKEGHVENDETKLMEQIRILTHKNAGYKKKIKRLKTHDKNQKKRIAYLEYIMNTSADRSILREHSDRNIDDASEEIERHNIEK